MSGETGTVWREARSGHEQPAVEPGSGVGLALYASRRPGCS